MDLNILFHHNYINALEATSPYIQLGQQVFADRHQLSTPQHFSRKFQYCQII